MYIFSKSEIVQSKLLKSIGGWILAYEKFQYKLIIYSGEKIKTACQIKGSFFYLKPVNRQASTSALLIKAN